MTTTKATEAHLLELASQVVALVRKQSLDMMEAVAAVNIAQVILAASPVDAPTSPSSPEL